MIFILHFIFLEMHSLSFSESSNSLNSFVFFDSCRICKKKDQLFSDRHVLFCRRCKKINEDICPIKPWRYFRSFDSRTWVQTKKIFYKCEECNGVFKRYYEYRKTRTLCPWCVKNIYLNSFPVTLVFDYEILCVEKCFCGKPLRINLYALFVRYYSMFRFEEIRLIRHMEDLKSLDSEIGRIEMNINSDVIHGFQQVFVIACNRRCLGKYKNIGLKHVCKFVWRIDKVRLTCFSCKKSEIVTVNDLGFFCEDCKFYCRECLFEKKYRTSTTEIPSCN